MTRQRRDPRSSRPTRGPYEAPQQHRSDRHTISPRTAPSDARTAPPVHGALVRPGEPAPHIRRWSVSFRSESAGDDAARRARQDRPPARPPGADPAGPGRPPHATKPTLAAHAAGGVEPRLFPPVAASALAVSPVPVRDVDEKAGQPRQPAPPAADHPAPTTRPRSSPPRLVQERGSPALYGRCRPVVLLARPGYHA